MPSPSWQPPGGGVHHQPQQNSSGAHSTLNSPVNPLARPPSTTQNNTASFLDSSFRTASMAPPSARSSKRKQNKATDIVPRERGADEDVFAQDKRRAKQLLQEAVGTRISSSHVRREESEGIESGESDHHEDDTWDDTKHTRKKHTPKPINLVGMRDRESKGCAFYYLIIIGLMMFTMSLAVLSVTVIVPVVYISQTSRTIYSSLSDTLVSDAGSIVSLEMSRVVGHIDEAAASIEANMITFRNNIDRFALFWDQNVSTEVELRYNKSYPYSGNETIETFVSPYSTNRSTQYMLPGLVLPPRLSIPLQYALGKPSFLNYAEYVHRLSEFKYEPFTAVNLSNIFEMQVRDWVIPTARNLIPKLGCSTFPRTRGGDATSFLTPHFASLNELAVMFGTSDHLVGVRCDGGNGFDPSPESIVVYAVFTRDVLNYDATSTSSTAKYEKLEYWEWRIPLLSDPKRTLDCMSASEFFTKGVRFPPKNIPSSLILTSTSKMFAEAKRANAIRTDRAQQGLSPVPKTFRFSTKTPGVLVLINDIGCSTNSCIDYGTLQQEDSVVTGMVVGIADFSGDYLSDSIEALKMSIVSVRSNVDFGLYIVDSNGYTVASTLVFDITRSYAVLVLSARTVEGIITWPSPKSAILVGMNFDESVSPSHNFTGLIPGYSAYAFEQLSSQEYSLINRRLSGGSMSSHTANLAASLGAKMAVGDYSYLATPTTPHSETFDHSHHSISFLEMRPYGLIVFAYVDFNAVAVEERDWAIFACWAITIIAAIIAVVCVLVSSVLLFPLLRARTAVQHWLWKESQAVLQRSIHQLLISRTDDIVIVSGEDDDDEDDEDFFEKMKFVSRRVKRPSVWFPFLFIPLAKEIYKIRTAFEIVGNAIFENEASLQEIQRIGDELNDAASAPATQQKLNEDAVGGLKKDILNDVSGAESHPKSALLEEEQDPSSKLSTEWTVNTVVPAAPIGCELSHALSSAIPLNHLVRTTAVILTVRLRVSTVSSGRRERMLKMYQKLVDEELRAEERDDGSQNQIANLRPLKQPISSSNRRAAFISPSGEYCVTFQPPSTGVDPNTKGSTIHLPTVSEIKAKALSSTSEAFRRLQKRIDLLVAKEHYIIHDLISRVIPHYHGEVISTDGSVATIAFSTHRGDGQVLSLSDVKALAVRCVDYALSRYVKRSAHHAPTDRSSTRSTISNYDSEAAESLPPTHDSKSLTKMLWRRSPAAAAMQATPESLSPFRKSSKGVFTEKKRAASTGRLSGRSGGDISPKPFASQQHHANSSSLRSSSLNSPRELGGMSLPKWTGIPSIKSFSGVTGVSGALRAGQLSGVHTLQGATDPALPLCPYQLSSSKYILASFDVSRCYRTRLGGNTENTYSTLFGDAIQRSRAINDFQRSNFSYIPVVCSDEFARLLVPPARDSVLAAATILGVENQIVDEDRSVPHFEAVNLCDDETSGQLDKFASLGDPRAVIAPLESTASSMDNGSFRKSPSGTHPNSFGPTTIRVHNGPYYCPYHDPERCPRAKEFMIQQSIHNGAHSSTSSMDSGRAISKGPISPPRATTAVPTLAPTAFGTHQHCAVCGGLPREGNQPSLDVVTVPIDVMASTVSVGITRRQGVLVHALLTQEVLRLDHLNTYGALAPLLSLYAVPMSIHHPKYQQQQGFSTVNSGDGGITTSNTHNSSSMSALPTIPPPPPSPTATTTGTPSSSPHEEYIMKYFETALKTSDCMLAAMLKKSNTVGNVDTDSSNDGVKSMLSMVEIGDRAVGCDATLQLLSIQQFPVFIVAAASSSSCHGNVGVNYSPSTSMHGGKPLSPSTPRDSQTPASPVGWPLPPFPFPPILGGNPFHPLTKACRPLADPPFVQFYHILTSIADGHFTDALTRAVSLLVVSEHVRSMADAAKRYDASIEAYLSRTQHTVTCSVGDTHHYQRCGAKANMSATDVPAVDWPSVDLAPQLNDFEFTPPRARPPKPAGARIRSFSKGNLAGVNSPHDASSDAFPSFQEHSGSIIHPNPSFARRPSVVSISLPIPQTMNDVGGGDGQVVDCGHSFRPNPPSPTATSGSVVDPAMLLVPLPEMLSRRLLQLIETCEIQLDKRRKQLGVEAVSREITKTLGCGVDNKELLYPSCVAHTINDDDETASSAPSELFRVCPLYVRKIRQPPAQHTPTTTARDTTTIAPPVRLTPLYARNTQCDHGPEGLYRKRELFGWDDSEMMQYFDLKDQDMRERFEDALSSQEIGSLGDRADLAMEAQHRRALGELYAHRQLDVGHTSLTLLHGRVMKTRSMSPSITFTGRSPSQPAEVGRAVVGCSFLSDEPSFMQSSQRQLLSNSGSMTSATVVVVGGAETSISTTYNTAILTPSAILPTPRVVIPLLAGDEDEKACPLNQRNTTYIQHSRGGSYDAPILDSSSGTHLPDVDGASNRLAYGTEDNVTGRPYYSRSLLSGSHSDSTIYYRNEEENDGCSGPTPPTSTMLNNPRGGLGITTFHNVVSASFERSPKAMSSWTAPHFGSHASVQANSSPMESVFQQSSAPQDSIFTYQVNRELGSSTEEFRGPLPSSDVPVSPTA